MSLEPHKLLREYVENLSSSNTFVSLRKSPKLIVTQQRFFEYFFFRYPFHLVLPLESIPTNGSPIGIMQTSTYKFPAMTLNVPKVYVAHLMEIERMN